jgi:hypothetical protein
VVFGTAEGAASRSWPRAGLFFSVAMTRGMVRVRAIQLLSRVLAGLCTLTSFLFRRS